MSESKVDIRITDELPPSIPCICDVGPNGVRMLIRAGMNQRQTVQAFGDMLGKMIELYPSDGPVES